MLPKWLYELMAEDRGRCMMTPPKCLVTLGVPKAGIIRNDVGTDENANTETSLAFPGYEDYAFDGVISEAVGILHAK